jgi:SAM-dependent methyltransferase
MNWIEEKEKKRDYKGFVGAAKNYDLIGKVVFDLLEKEGLKKHHYFLDIGCGSLRVGKYLIPWLYKNRYYGNEPCAWLIEEALKNELAENIKEKKNPKFLFNNIFLFEQDESFFDFVLANSVFIHASKKQIEICINNVKEVLKPEGVFIFNYFEGNADNKLNEFKYPGAVKYTKKYITELLKDFNYKFLTVPKYPGAQKWVKVTLKKD